MLTDQDIQKLIKEFSAVFSTRQEIDSKFDAMHKDFSDLQTAVDAYAKKADTYFQEMVMLSQKVKTLEKWLHQIADKVGVQLEYL